MNNQIFGIFGILGLGCGLYCLYGYYLLKVKGEINTNLFLPKGTNVKKCKDHAAYCKEVQFPLLLVSIMAILYGVADLINVFVTEINLLFGITLILLLIALFVFMVKVRKCNQKYFGI